MLSGTAGHNFAAESIKNNVSILEPADDISISVYYTT